MTALVPIGEFSRLTHLTVKTLRYYHEVGLLAPARIDDHSGYRRYALDQLPTALLIGRLRSLTMPLPEVQAVVATPDGPDRDAMISAHLARMEAELDRTRAIVHSLRELLRPQAPAVEVTYRTAPDVRSVAVTERVARGQIGAWCRRTFTHLYGTLLAAGGIPTGPGAALYDSAFFTDGLGEVTAYIPIGDGRATAGLPVGTIPGGEFAVAVHAGPFVDFDLSYAALGSYVAEHGTSRTDPIRELYVLGPPEITDEADFRTEIWWPVADRPTPTHRKDLP